MCLLISMLLGPTPPQDVQATTEGPCVRVSWKKPLHPIVKFVKQYTVQIIENETCMHDTVKGDEYVYVISNCKPSTIYSFEISTITLNNLESTLSEKIDIQTQGRTFVVMNKCVTI